MPTTMKMLDNRVLKPRGIPKAESFVMVSVSIDFGYSPVYPTDGPLFIDFSSNLDNTSLMNICSQVL